MNEADKAMRRMTFFLLFLLCSLAAALGQESYFPQGVLEDNPQGDSFRSNWYSKHLKALGEPSLSQMAKDSKAESYRFVWLRTFHHPVIVRVDIKADGSAELTTKVSNGAGGYEPGKLIENASRPLIQRQTDKFLATIKRLQFWELPTNETSEGVGCDGSQWIIEAVKDGKYHVVDRWTPGKGAVHDLGLTFIFGLAQMRIPKDELY
jgi:hypothetical protein